MTIAERLTDAREKEGLSQAELASRAGVSQGTIGNIESGARKNPRELLAIARVLNVEPEWLKTGKPPRRIHHAEIVEGINIGNSTRVVPMFSRRVRAHHPDDPLDPEEVLIKESRVSFAAGPGAAPVYELMEESEPATYRLSWFQKERIKPEDCVRFRVTNDSQEPFLFAGDTILVNTAETDPRDERTYALRYGNELRVKKVRKLLSGGLVLISWNDRLYPPETLSPEEVQEHIQIIGRVRDKSGRGGL